MSLFSHSSDPLTHALKHGKKAFQETAHSNTKLLDGAREKATEAWKEALSHADDAWSETRAEAESSWEQAKESALAAWKDAAQEASANRAPWIIAGLIAGGVVAAGLSWSVRSCRGELARP